MKPYDYIIGRLKGEFSPGDPASYRNNRKNQTNSIVYDYPFRTKNNDKINSEVSADSRTYDSHFPNVAYSMGAHDRVLNPC